MYVKTNKEFLRTGENMRKIKYKQIVSQLKSFREFTELAHETFKSFWIYVSIKGFWEFYVFYVDTICKHELD